MKKTVISSIIVLTLIICTGEGLAAPGRAGRGPGDMVAGLFYLDLTEAQKASVAKILKSHREATKNAGEQLRAARLELRKVMASGEADETAVRRAYQDVARAGEELVVLLARVQKEVRGVLTEDQAARLKEMKEDRLEASAARTQARQGLFDKWIERHAQ